MVVQYVRSYYELTQNHTLLIMKLFDSHAAVF